MPPLRYTFLTFGGCAATDAVRVAMTGSTDPDLATTKAAEEMNAVHDRYEDLRGGGSGGPS